VRRDPAGGLAHVAGAVALHLLVDRLDRRVHGRGGAGTLAGLLTGAQLTDVVVSEVSVPLRAASFDEWFTTVPALAGPIAAVLASLPDDAIAAIRAHAERAFAPYAGRDGYDIPGVSLVAAGRRG